MLPIPSRRVLMTVQNISEQRIRSAHVVRSYITGIQRKHGQSDGASIGQTLIVPVPLVVTGITATVEKREREGALGERPIGIFAGPPIIATNRERRQMEARSLALSGKLFALAMVIVACAAVKPSH
jgi:hypothetical protein